MALMALKGVGRGKAFAISKEINLSKIDSADKLCTGLSKSSLGQLADMSILNSAWGKVEKISKVCELNEVEIINYWDSQYPDSLKRIKDSPIILYCKGDTNLLSAKSLAIVGTRKPDSFGLESSYKLAKDLASNGFTIVSGLAEGIDTEAHKGALDAGGKTIAVLAHGLDTVSPQKNRQLAMDIIESDGLLISEYPPGSRVEKSNYVQRNRIQSALSQGVIVVQSGLKGGTMQTAKHAQSQNRFLLVVQHPKKSMEHYAGNEELVGQGAISLSADSSADRITELMRTHTVASNKSGQKMLDEY